MRRDRPTGTSRLRSCDAWRKRCDWTNGSALYRLALPEIRLAVEQFERTTNDGSLHKLRAIRTLLPRVTGAGSFEEAASAAVENVLEALDPSSVAVAVLASGEHAQRLIPAAPRSGVEIVQSTVADTHLVANYPDRFGFSLRMDAIAETFAHFGRHRAQ